MVVDLHHVDVGARDAGHGEGRVGRGRHAGVQPVGRVEGRVVVRMGFGRAQHVNRLLLQVLRARGRGHHQRAAAIGHQAAVALAQRLGNHGRGHHLVDAGGLAPVGLGVQLGPAPRGHRHLGQIFGRGAVAMHVQLRDHGVVANRAQVAIGQDELAARRVRHIGRHSATFARAIRQLRAAVGDQRHLAHARRNGRRGALHVQQVGHAAHVGRVDKARAQAQKLGHLQAGKPVVGVGKHAVHVGQLQARFVQGQLGGLGLQFKRRFAGHLAQIGLGHAHDGDGFGQRRVHAATSSFNA